MRRTDFTQSAIKHPILRVVFGLAISLTVYFLFFYAPESPEARLRRIETAMRYNQALPIYRLMARQDPKQYKALERRILLYELANSEESKDDRSISYHNFSILALKGYFRQAAKPVILKYIRAHYVLLQNLYLSSPEKVLQFQYPEIYGLLQPHEVADIPALGEFLLIVEELIKSAVETNTNLQYGNGALEAGKYHHNFEATNPLDASALSKFKHANTIELKAEVAKAIVKFYEGILKLPDDQIYIIWQRLFETASFE